MKAIFDKDGNRLSSADVMYEFIKESAERNGLDIEEVYAGVDEEGSPHRVYTTRMDMTQQRYLILMNALYPNGKRTTQEFVAISFLIAAALLAIIYVAQL